MTPKQASWTRLGYTVNLTGITPLSIDAAETADGVPEGSWVTHTAKRTVYGVGMYFVLSECAISHSSKSPAECGSGPHGVDVFSMVQIYLIFSAHGVNPG